MADLKFNILVTVLIVIIIVIYTIGGIFLFYLLRHGPYVHRVIDPACLDLRLIDCQVMTSHNSYLSMAQIGPTSATMAISDALRKGFRALELDVVNEGTQMIVGHYLVESGKKTLFSSTTPLEVCLNIIKNQAFVDQTEPLFVFIEDNTDRAVVDVVATANAFFGDLAYTDFTTENFGDLMMNSIMGKIIVVRSDNGQYIINKSSATGVADIVFSKPVRIYPTFDPSAILSYNPPTLIPHLRNGANFVAVNCNFEDPVYDTYTRHFGEYNIIPRV